MEIADHLPVFTLSYDLTLSPFPNKIETRDFKRFDKIAFKQVVRNANWTPVYKSYDVNESLTRFFHTFNNISNSHALLKSINIKNKSDKPWVTKGLRKSIKIRNELYKKWLTTRNIIMSNIKFIETRLFQLIKPFEPYTTIVYLRTPQKHKKCGVMLTL